MSKRTFGAAAPWVIVLCLGLAPAACATYQDELSSGQRAFEASEHERALAIFRVLEPDMARLSTSERAHYAYLRGMTDYRIGYKAEARHWLSLAASIEQAVPGSLPDDWTRRMQESLKELNEEVYTAGIEALSNAATPKSKVSEEPAPPEEAAPPGKKRD
jgi:hypothetical protein